MISIKQTPTTVIKMCDDLAPLDVIKHRNDFYLVITLGGNERIFNEYYSNDKSLLLNLSKNKLELWDNESFDSKYEVFDLDCSIKPMVEN